MQWRSDTLVAARTREAVVMEAEPDGDERVFMAFSGFAQVEKAASVRSRDRNLAGAVGGGDGPV